MKPQIEKVTHYVSEYDNYIVCSYMPAQDKCMNVSFYNVENARKSSDFHTGFWRIKQSKN